MKGTASNELGLALARLRACRSHARHGCTLPQAAQDALSRRLVELAELESWLCSDIARALDAEAKRLTRAGAVP